MALQYEKKIVLYCPAGYRTSLDSLVEDFIKAGVIFVGVVGKDCAKVEGTVDALVVGDGSREYDLLTSSHPNESVEEALEFARSLSLDFDGPVQLVTLDK